MRELINLSYFAFVSLILYTAVTPNDGWVISCIN